MRRGVGAALVLGAAVWTGCTVAPAPEQAAAPAPEPVVPPAACVLDVAALAAATGLSWTADATTASDTRCVYDPDPDAGDGFVSVEVLPAAPAGADQATAAPDVPAPDVPAPDVPAPDVPRLETLAQACAAGSREPVGTDGFVCRFPGGGVFAARDRADTMLTVAAAEVPVGTTPERLTAAFGEQLAEAG
ncbi:hypothetical protein [Pseudonocardia sp.]|uniref:hypothetical protein n=1 Tax=Pseudonocardia sp. TaxID=60912 RepID=UPI00261850CC|nr:hypothetical protein [Pseudonocardia sp.]